MKKQEENSIYRIEECAKGFIVQKKSETKTKNGFLPWSKWKTTVYWGDVDENGQYINFVSKKQVEIYSTLSKAQKAVENFKKFPIYHY